MRRLIGLLMLLAVATTPAAADEGPCKRDRSWNPMHWFLEDLGRLLCYVGVAERKHMAEERAIPSYTGYVPPPPPPYDGPAEPPQAWQPEPYRAPAGTRPATPASLPDITR